MLPTQESEIVEFKASLTSECKLKSGKAIVAFANTK
jgi:hypothetical protein